MSIITEARLTAFLPNLPNVAVWTRALDEVMERFEITTPERTAAFLAQIAHESGDFRRLVESLNYTASRLMKVWPKRFPTLEKAAEYARQPEKLANYVYAKRLGNGDVASGDGWMYRGRGLIQLTGRANYQSAGRALSRPFEAQPELLEEPESAALTAAHFWQSRGLNELADDRNDDSDDADFVRISVIINGGRVGLPERRESWARAKVALTQAMDV
jgi:putative chitinase